MEDCSDIVLVARNDLTGFEAKCKPCFDLRLKAETSHLMCFNHIDDSLSTIQFYSEKKEESNVFTILMIVEVIVITAVLV